jgi:hypothetical protein
MAERSLWSAVGIDGLFFIFTIVKMKGPNKQIQSINQTTACFSTVFVNPFLNLPLAYTQIN